MTPTLRAVPVDKELAAKLRKAAKQSAHWREERDRLVREASAAGGSLREIAALVGLSNPGVKRILDRG